jgi:hypothetical protein
LFRGPGAAYLGVDFDELPNELLESAEFGDLKRGFFLGGGSWQRLGNGLALLFVGQAWVRPVNRLAGLVAATVGLATTAAGIGDGAAAEITKVGQLFDDFGTARFQVWQSIGHGKEGSSILAYYIR